jgi:hypothetical protein
MWLVLEYLMDMEVKKKLKKKKSFLFKILDWSLEIKEKNKLIKEKFLILQK